MPQHAVKFIAQTDINNLALSKSASSIKKFQSAAKWSNSTSVRRNERIIYDLQLGS